MLPEQLEVTEVMETDCLSAGNGDPSSKSILQLHIQPMSGAGHGLEKLSPTFLRNSAILKGLQHLAKIFLSGVSNYCKYCNAQQPGVPAAPLIPTSYPPQQCQCQRELSPAPFQGLLICIAFSSVLITVR